MGPGVDMWITAEVEDCVRAFDLPDIPYSVLAHVLILEKGHMQVVETARFDVARGFLGIVLTERFEQIADHLAHEVLLIAAEFAYADAFEAGFFADRKSVV